MLDTIILIVVILVVIRVGRFFMRALTLVAGLGYLALRYTFLSDLFQ